jgi:hypothetical protein
MDQDKEATRGFPSHESLCIALRGYSYVVPLENSNIPSKTALLKRAQRLCTFSFFIL